MPDIIIEYTESFRQQAAHWLEDVLKQRLGQVCVDCFTVPTWPLSTRSFGFKFVTVRPPDTATNDVIVRIELHNFPERVQAAEEHARIIRDATILIIERSNPMGWIVKPSVGVGLKYTPTAWSSGTIYDI